MPRENACSRSEVPVRSGARAISHTRRRAREPHRARVVGRARPSRTREPLGTLVDSSLRERPRLANRGAREDRLRPCPRHARAYATWMLTRACTRPCTLRRARSPLPAHAFRAHMRVIAGVRGRPTRRCVASRAFVPIRACVTRRRGRRMRPDMTPRAPVDNVDAACQTRWPCTRTPGALPALEARAYPRGV